MPPPTDLRMPCSPLTFTTESYNSTANPDINNEDLNALLYIVVTLCFYSLGIVVGIITYLKREKREMEESKTFEMFMSLKNDPFTATKVRRVKIVTEKLEQIERAKAAKEEMENRERERLMKEHEEGVKRENLGGQEGEKEEEKADSIHLPSENDISDRPGDLNVNDTGLDSKEDSQKLQLKKQPNVFQVSPSGEPISSVVAKIFETERRGGLPNSPKALHLFNSRGRLSRDQSIDSPNRGPMIRDQSQDKNLGNCTTDSKDEQPEPEGCLVTNV